MEDNNPHSWSIQLSVTQLAVFVLVICTNILPHISHGNCQQ